MLPGRPYNLLTNFKDFGDNLFEEFLKSESVEARKLGISSHIVATLESEFRHKMSFGRRV